MKTLKNLKKFEISTTKLKEVNGSAFEDFRLDCVTVEDGDTLCCSSCGGERPVCIWL